VAISNRTASRLKSHYVDLTAQSALPWGTTLTGNNTEQVADDVNAALNKAKVLDMKNVLPTTFGYTSFFGERDIQLPPVSMLTDEAFMYDTPTGRRLMLALGADGLRVSFDGLAWDDKYTALNTPNTLADIQTGLGDAFSVTTSVADITAANLLASPVVESVLPASEGITLLTAAPEQRDSRDQVVAEGTARVSFSTYVDWLSAGGLPLTDNLQVGYDANAPIPPYLTPDATILVVPIDPVTNFMHAGTVYRGVSSLPAAKGVVLDPANPWVASIVDLATLNPQLGDVIHVAASTYTVTALPYDPSAAAIALAAQFPVQNAHPEVKASGTTLVFSFNVNSIYYNGARYAYISDGTPLTAVVDTATVVTTFDITEGSGYNMPQLIHGFPAPVTTAEYIAVDIAAVNAAIGNNVAGFGGFSLGDSFIMYMDGVAVDPLLVQGDLWIYRTPTQSIGYGFLFGDSSAWGNGAITPVPVYAATVTGMVAKPDAPTNQLQGSNQPIPTSITLNPAVTAGMDVGVIILQGKTTVWLPRQSAAAPIDLLATPAYSRVASWSYRGYSTIAWATLASPTVTKYSNAVKFPVYSQLDYAVTRKYALSFVEDSLLVEQVLEFEVTVLGYTQNLGWASSSPSSAQGQGLTNRTRLQNLPVVPQLADFQYGVQHATPWTHAVVRNKLYLYRQGMGGFLTVNAAGTALELVYPTFANMQFVQGIASAKGRMLMWDSENSIYRSSVLDALDFTPSIATQATVHKIDALKGDIVTIESMGDSYIVYGSASIIAGVYAGEVTIFTYKTLSEFHGVYQAKAVTRIAIDTHAAYLDNGLYQITLQGIAALSTEVSEYLASSDVPVRLDFLAGKYLAISAAPALPTTSIEEFRSVAGRNLFDALRIDSIPGAANNYNWNMLDFGGSEINHDWLYTLTDALPVTPKGLAIHQAEIARDNPAVGMSLVPVATVRTPYILWVMQMIQLNWVTNVYLTTAAMDKAFGAESHLQLSASADSLVNPYATPRNLHAGDFALTYLERAGIYNLSEMPAHFAVNTLHTWSNANSSGNYDNTTGDTFTTFPIYVGNSQVAIPPEIYAHYGVYGDPAMMSFTPADPSAPAAQIPAGSVGITNNGSMLTFTVADALATLAAAATVLPLNGFDLPAVALPPGHFMGVQGQTASIPPVFNRTLLLDVQLGTWGSCDVPVRCMFDYSPVNAPTTTVATGTAGHAYTLGYDDFALKLSAVRADGQLVTFTPDPADSFLTVGKCGFFEQYLTRLTEVRWDVIRSVKAAIGVKSSIDGTRLSPSMGKDTKGDGMFLRTTRVGKWFLFTLNGNFAVKGLSFKGVFGGKR